MNSWLKSTIFWSVLMVIFHLFLLLKLQFTAWPELLVYSHLLQNGFTYYGEIIQPYFPTLAYLLTAIYNVFGLSVLTLRITTYVFILTADVLLLIILMRTAKGNSRAVIFGGFVYVILQVLFEGNGLWFDNATVPSLLLAYLFWQNYQRKKAHHYLILSGFLIGSAFIIKQSAVWFIVVLTFYIFFKKNWKQGLIFGLSTAAPFLLLFLFFNPSDIWYWDIYYPFMFMSRSSGYMLLPTLRQAATIVFIFIPLVIILFKRDPVYLEPLLWLIAASVFIIPRFAYFHFQVAVPFLVICLCVLFEKLSRNVRIPLTTLYLIGIGFLMARFSIHQLNQPVRFFEPAVYETAAKLRQVIPENTQAFYYNDMGNVMVAGGFVPPKPWAYNFPWYMEIPQLQSTIVKSLIKDQVEWVVVTPFSEEGAYTPGSYKPILLDAFFRKYYRFQDQISPNIQLWKKISNSTPSL